MMTKFAWLSVVLPLAATVVTAQHPDLSGEWVRVDSVARSVAATGDASFRRGDMGSGWGATLGIAQRPDSIVIAYDYFVAYDLQPRVRLAYAADGGASRISVMIGHTESVQSARLSWEGSAMVIRTTHPAPLHTAGRIPETVVRQTLTLDADGSLVVETTRGQTSATRTVYRKK
jgi:hypothetical protein